MSQGWLRQPRGFHGRWITGGEQEVVRGLNHQGRAIMRGHGSTHRFPMAGRERIHHGYLRAEMRGHGKQAHPEALFTSGGAASGKSFITNTRAPRDAVIIDADRAKTGENVKGYEGIPEYHDLINTGNSEQAAAAVHEESSDMSKQLTNLAMQKKRNIVVDSVGNSKPSKFAKKLRAAVNAGYRVRVEHMHVPIGIALESEVQRSRKTNRKVKEGTLKTGHIGSARAMGAAARVPGVHITIWGRDNSGAKPHIIAQGVGGPRGLGGLTVYDRAGFDEFLRKGGHK